MMSFLDYFRANKKQTQTPAQIAKERLQVVIAHQRSARSSRYDFLPELQNEILTVIRRYIAIADDQVQVQLEREGDCDVLELNVTLPDKD